MRHLHLDPVGGAAGDMFVGALLDLHPELAGAVVAAVRAAGLTEAVELAHVPYGDGVLQGSRFDVRLPSTQPPAHDHLHHSGHPHVHAHAHDHVHMPADDHDADHPHVTWSELRSQLAGSALAAPVRARAIEIFTLLADAEARVHGKSVTDVAFHEVGAWDSIADIVAAACVIEALAPCTWSIGALPIGSGRVPSAHGVLPVPAPATVLLLEGFRCFDDGFPGERVTPTGAAILRHLQPAAGLGALPRILHRIGHGFGTRRFAGLSNVLRVVEFTPDLASRARPEQVAVVRFEIDDQTAEDLALGLDRLRDLDGVLDVCQATLVGKRGRLMAGIQVLAKPAAIAAVTAACFHETTTLGLRVQCIDRLVLERSLARSTSGVGVKLAERDAGRTAKAELADLAAHEGHESRQRARGRAERELLEGTPDDG